MTHQDYGKGEARPAGAGSGPSNQSGLGGSFDGVEGIASSAGSKEPSPKKPNGDGRDHPPATLDELKPLPMWVGWQNVTRKGQTTKLPYDPKNGRQAASDNPQTWATHAQAEEWARA